MVSFKHKNNIIIPGFFMTVLVTSLFMDYIHVHVCMGALFLKLKKKNFAALFFKLGR